MWARQSGVAMSDEEIKTPEGKAANESGGTVIKPEATTCGRTTGRCSSCAGGCGT